MRWFNMEYRADKAPDISSVPICENNLFQAFDGKMNQTCTRGGMLKIKYKLINSVLL